MTGQVQKVWVYRRRDKTWTFSCPVCSEDRPADTFDNIVRLADLHIETHSAEEGTRDD